MEKLLISIVTPIYNRECTLHYCIESILHQDYNNWELLLVDDGSTDNSAEICKAYTKKDQRIRYFYQDNEGAGPARNKGIENANGEWITFVDSDDAIMPNHLMQVVKYGKGNDLVMVNHCQANYINGKLTKQGEYWNNIDNVQITGNENIIDYVFGKLDPYNYFVYCCWDKFFRRDVIEKNNLLFPIDIPTGQDMYFVVDFFKHTKNFYFTNEGTYAQTPMGNDAIDHLAWRLRHPQEYFHCHKRNYENLLSLYKTTNNEKVKKYAVHYILTDTFVRSFLRYTNWHNRRLLSKSEVLRFINDDFMPTIKELADMLDYVRNDLYRNQLKQILKGGGGKVYNYWFYKSLKQGIINKMKRLLK